uniref:Uncharacterized protein n=2 Tax=Oryza sativa subsp. japonica TaxID=39947 RepID=Q2R5D1_ORYSJ|nr:hypothetical protein LOC_Os11g25420 [Oryza sativa Japonica Group]ABA93351.1 hypothetical protein LOC_Os11g25420 [Oryza sativa Japonica Group]
MEAAAPAMLAPSSLGRRQHGWRPPPATSVQYEASADELYVRGRDPPFLLSQPVMAMALSATAGRRASGKTESFVTAGGNSGLYG